jgi:hypothetical protein
VQTTLRQTCWGQNIFSADSIVKITTNILSVRQAKRNETPTKREFGIGLMHLMYTQTNINTLSLYLFFDREIIAELIITVAMRK